VDWIDEAGVTLKSLPRAEIRRLNLLHRVTGTLVFHPNGRIFVHRRTDAKDVYPGLYDMAVGGTVASGESYTENACRELAEELGVRGIPLYWLFSHRFQDPSSNSLTEVFACVTEGPFLLQHEEIAEGSWRHPDAVAELIATNRVCPDSAQTWRLFCEQTGEQGNLLDRITADSLRPVDCAGRQP